MLQQGLVQQEWRVPQMLQRILEDLLPHLDHPYKAVRDRLGRSVQPPSALIAHLSTGYPYSPGKVFRRAHASLINEGCVVVVKDKKVPMVFWGMVKDETMTMVFWGMVKDKKVPMVFWGMVKDKTMTMVFCRSGECLSRAYIYKPDKWRLCCCGYTRGSFCLGHIYIYKPDKWRLCHCGYRMKRADTFKCSLLGCGMCHAFPREHI